MRAGGRGAGALWRILNQEPMHLGEVHQEQMTLHVFTFREVTGSIWTCTPTMYIYCADAMHRALALAT